MTSPLPFQITVARQLGSGGAELGQRIACRMGFVYLDRQILQQVAQELGISEAEVAGREDRIKSFWVRIMETFSAGCPEYMMSNPPPRIISDDTLIETEQRVLLHLAAGGSCVIVGRCGFHLLAGRAPLLNVFVHASRSFRIERMIKLYGASSRSVAEEMIDETDQNREQYVEIIAKKLWYDARNYHLSIDLSQTGLDMAEEMIVLLANRMVDLNSEP